MCSRFLKSSKEARHGRVYLFFERMFDRLLACYEWGLKRVLKSQFLTLCVFLGTLMVTGMLYVEIPKGFFPEQDKGSISGSAEGAQDISSAAMWNHLGAMAKIVGEDPDVAGVGYTAGSSAFNTGNYYINLKLRSKRGASADQIIARLRPKLHAVAGANLFLQVPQDIRVGGDPAGPNTNTPCRTPISTNSMCGRRSWWRSCKRVPQLADVTSDQQASAASATFTIDRDRAARFGIQPALIDATIYDAIGQRDVAQYFTQLNSYHVVLEVDPALQTDPRLFRQAVSHLAHYGTAGAFVILWAR